MAHKITLGARPKTLKHIARVRMPDGTDGEIEVAYVYRTRREFGALIDQMAQEAGVAPQLAGDDVRLAQIMDAAIDRNAAYLLRVIDSWGLDVPLSIDTVQQLCDELPGVARQLMEDYRILCTEGRLGN